MITHLSSQETRALIAEGRTGRLGCIVDGSPYVVPVNYVFDGEDIYVHSMPGKKIDALRSDPRACLQVDQVSDEFHWRSALAFGRFEEITETAERVRVLRNILARFPNLTPIEANLDHGPLHQQTVVFRIKIDNITGVAEG